MSTVTIEEAQAKLADLIDKLVLGEEVIITRNQQPVAKLVAQQHVTRKPRQPGNCNSVIKFFVLDVLPNWVVAVPTGLAPDSALPHPSAIDRLASYHDPIVRCLTCLCGLK